MKRNEITQLHGLSTAELQAKLQETYKELRTLTMQKFAGKLANTARVRVLRDFVARIKTIIREKELAVPTTTQQHNNITT